MDILIPSFIIFNKLLYLLEINVEFRTMLIGERVGDCSGKQQAR
ncbi:hypothetical protein [Heyndrickxia acidicola]|nr:hypothetical protein [Heyndrickxia acidicola]